MYSKKLTIDQMKLQNRRVLIRVDLDVPIEEGAITDTKPIEEVIPTIKYALEKQVKSIVLISHLGSPGGNVNEALTLQPVSIALQNLLGVNVVFLNDCVGFQVERECSNPEDGSVYLLENLRYHPEEEGVLYNEEGEPFPMDSDKIRKFKKKLGVLGDIFINDAFSVCHTKCASLSGDGFVFKGAGLALKKQLKALSNTFDKTRKPLVVIMGGKDVRNKLQMINNLSYDARDIIVTGEICFTFLKALEDVAIGDTTFDEFAAEEIKQMMPKLRKHGCKLHFPVDFVVAESASDESEEEVFGKDFGVPDGKKGFDMGNTSLNLFEEVLKEAKSIIWTGVPGCYEVEKFSKGTKGILNELISATKRGVWTYVCGHKVVEACKLYGAETKLSHLTAHQSSRFVLEGKPLPGVNGLSDVCDCVD